jgi:hypothetical protein
MHQKTLKLVLACLFVLPSAAIASDIYKWTDDSGGVHYGQQHPPGVDAQQVRIVHDGPTPEEQAAAKTQMDALVKKAGLEPEQIAQEDTQRAQAQSVEAAAAAARDSSCTSARHLLLKLENWAHRAIVQNADGSQTRLDSIQRQALIDRTNAQIDTNCGG